MRFRPCAAGCGLDERDERGRRQRPVGQHRRWRRTPRQTRVGAGRRAWDPPLHESAGGVGEWRWSHRGRARRGGPHHAFPVRDKHCRQTPCCWRSHHCRCCCCGHCEGCQWRRMGWRQHRCHQLLRWRQRHGQRMQETHRRGQKPKEPQQEIGTAQSPYLHLLSRHRASRRCVRWIQLPPRQWRWRAAAPGAGLSKCGKSSSVSGAAETPCQSSDESAANPCGTWGVLRINGE